METAIRKNRNIEENLKDPEFVRMLREHPIVKNKVERARKSLDALKAMEQAKQRD